MMQPMFVVGIIIMEWLLLLLLFQAVMVLAAFIIIITIITIITIYTKVFFDRIFVIFHCSFSYMFNKKSSYVIHNTSRFDCTSILL